MPRYPTVVRGSARVFGWARGRQWAEVYGEARVGDNARASGNAVITYHAQACGVAWVRGDAKVYDEAVLNDGIWDTGVIHETPDGPRFDVVETVSSLQVRVHAPPRQAG